MSAGATLNATINFLLGRNTVTPEANRAAESIDKVGKSANTARAQVANLAGAFTGMVAAGWVQRGIEAILKPTLDLEMSLKNLETVTRASKSEMAKYREEAFRVAAITPYGAKDMTDAMTKLAQATGSAEAGMRLTETAAQVAMASFGKINVENATKMLGELMRGFSLTEDQTKIAADKVVAGTRAMGLGLEDVNRSMGRLSIAAIRGNQSFDEIVKTFLLLKTVMPSQERAATLIRNLSGALPSAQAQKGLGLIGVTTMDEGKPRRMRDILLDLATRYRQSATSTRSAINQAFGEQAVQPVLGILSKLVHGMKGANNEMLTMQDVLKYQNDVFNNAGGATENLSTKYKETVSASVENLKNSVENLLVSMGDKLLPMLGMIAEALQKVAGAIETVLRNPIVGTFATAALRIGVLSAALWAGRAALQGFGKIIALVNMNLDTAGPALNLATSRVALFTSAMAAAPTAVGKAKVALAGLKVAGLAAFTALKNAARTMWAAVGGPIGLLVTVISFLPEIKAAVQAASSSLADTAMEWAKAGGVKGLLAKGLAVLPGVKDDIIAKTVEKHATLLRQTSELMKKDGEAFYHYLQLGSKELKEAMKDLKDILDYEPKTVEWGRAAEAKTAMVALGRQKGLPPTMEEARRGVIQSLMDAAAIQKKAEAGEITPREYHQQMQDIVRGAYTGVSVLGKMGFISPTMVKNFKKQFAAPMMELGTEGAMAFSGAYTQLVGGRRVTTGAPIDGWTPSAGGISMTGSAPEGLYGMLPREAPAGPQPWEGGWKQPTSPFKMQPGFQSDRADMERISSSMMKETAKALAGGFLKLDQRLGGTINVRIVDGGPQSSDPMSGGGGGGGSFFNFRGR